MRTILLFLIIALLTGCGPSKKVLKTDITTTTNTSAVKVDTSAVKVAWDDVLNTVVNQIDMSTIKITTYYPTIDSVTGKQPVKSDIVIDKNIKTDLTTERKASGTELKLSGISEETKQNSQSREIVQEKEKKTGIPIKYYLIGFAVLAGIGYLAYKFIRHQFF